MASSFQNKIIKEYERKGYLVLKVIKLSANGYPDLQCLKNGETIWIECKEEKDTLKDLQKLRIDQLIERGFTAFCIQKNKGIIYGKPHSITEQ